MEAMTEISCARTVASAAPRNVQFQHTDEEQISSNIGCAGDADE